MSIRIAQVKPKEPSGEPVFVRRNGSDFIEAVYFDCVAVDGNGDRYRVRLDTSGGSLPVMSDGASSLSSAGAMVLIVAGFNCRACSLSSVVN